MGEVLVGGVVFNVWCQDFTTLIGAYRSGVLCAVGRRNGGFVGGFVHYLIAMRGWS